MRVKYQIVVDHLIQQMRDNLYDVNLSLNPDDRKLIDNYLEIIEILQLIKDGTLTQEGLRSS